MFKESEYVYVRGLPASKREYRTKKGLAKVVAAIHLECGYIMGSKSQSYYNVRFVGEETVFRAYEEHLRPLSSKEKRAIKFVEYLKPVNISPLAPK